MGEVTFLDCRCAQMIAQAAQALPGPGQLVIGDASPIVCRLFGVSGLDASVLVDSAPARGPLSLGRAAALSAPRTPV